MLRDKSFLIDITNSDLFLDLPKSSQCLYFHILLGDEDDEGYLIQGIKGIARKVGCSNEDIKNLLDANLIFKCSEYSYKISDMPNVFRIQ